MAVMSAPVSIFPQRHVRILYADDMPELREVARISFSRDGHGIECVADGALALQRIIADAGFDLVITDHHMPNMNGLELVGRLRDIGYPGRIIVFSSELSAEVAAEYVTLQVDRVVYKPVYPSALRQLIAELFPEPARAAGRGSASFSPAVSRH
jgi:two-component system, chemotaxis family, chemotaxis protein CheY